MKRKANSLVRNPSIFGDISSPLSFGDQYFDQSLAHQELKERIETEAKHDSKAKKVELKHEKRRFEKLMAKLNLLSCTTAKKCYGRGRNREEKTIHDPRCAKCELRKEAQALRIYCYEWPLPESESAAKSVVFELDIPRLIRAWRSTTYRILADVLSASPPQAKPKCVTLTEYEGLARHLKSKSDRLQLASSTKPLVQAQPVVEASEDSVCLPNNLTLLCRIPNLSAQLASILLNTISRRDVLRNFHRVVMKQFSMQSTTPSILRMKLFPSMVPALTALVHTGARLCSVAQRSQTSGTVFFFFSFLFENSL